MKISHAVSAVLALVLNSCLLTARAADGADRTELAELGFSVIPYPQQVRLTDAYFRLGPDVTIVIDTEASDADRFTAPHLADTLGNGWNIEAQIDTRPVPRSIRLSKHNP